MWLGFAVKHVARKIAIGTDAVVAAVLATESARKITKNVIKSAKALGEAAIEEINTQRKAKATGTTIPGSR
jgi:uncharacterized membrane protein YebE (DUF533 family)